MSNSVLVTEYGRNYGRARSFPSGLTAVLLFQTNPLHSVHARLVPGPNLTYRVLVPQGVPAIEFSSIHLNDDSGNSLFVFELDSPLTVQTEQSLSVDIVVPAYSIMSADASPGSSPVAAGVVYTSVDALPMNGEDTTLGSNSVITAVGLSDEQSSIAVRMNGVWSFSSHVVSAEATLVFTDQECSLLLKPKDAGLNVKMDFLQFVDEARGSVRSFRTLQAQSPTSIDIRLTHTLPTGVSSGSRVLVFSPLSVSVTKTDPALAAALKRVEATAQEMVTKTVLDSALQELHAKMAALSATTEGLSEKMKSVDATLSGLSFTRRK